MRIVILVACLWLATPSLWGKIVFYSDRDGNYEIYTMNADGSNQTRLTFNQAGDFAPAWSPNGRQIVFANFRDDEHLADIDLDEYNAEIYVMDDVFAIRPDGTDLWRVSEPKPDTGSYLGGWSAGGKDNRYIIRGVQVSKCAATRISY